MKPEELERACLQAIESRTRITLPWPKGQRIPTGFPTGEIFERDCFGNESKLQAREASSLA
jgi:hypothetical protein